MASRRGGANNQGQAPLPLACSRSERSCARYPDAEPAQPASSKTLFPQATQKLALRATGADHRQAEELCRGEGFCRISKPSMVGQVDYCTRTLDESTC